MKSIIIALSLFLSAAFAYAGQDTLVSRDDKQLKVEVTVYNNNLGLVKDMRRVSLPKGEGELRFMDVAAQIIPETVRVKSVNRPDDLSVLEQNYEYDLISHAKLMDKYVGKKIKLVDWNRFADRKEVVEATLLSNNQGQVYKIGDEIYLGHNGIKVLPEIPENLISKPTLTWLYENETKAAHNLEVTYLTRGISWKADYILALNADDTAADLSGWVTLNNTSGAAYKNAKLKLVAGEVNQVTPSAAYAMEESLGFSRKEKRDSFQERGFFEYHIYDLQRLTTIKDRQTKQVSLLGAEGLAVEKEFVVHGIQNYFTRRYQTNNPKQPVNVYVKFKNSKKNHLGMPLPGGVMRLYKKDHDGSLQLVGEDRVEHSPKDEEVKLKVGEAFDIVAERKQTDYKRITSQLHESEWEITLRNHKDHAVKVSILEPLYGSWTVISNSHKYEKVDAFTLRFDAKVPKDGEVKVKYRVKVGLE